MLTDIQCRAARPHEKPCKLPGGSGLLVEVKPNGVKAWRYRFKLNVQGVTKESMFAIGDYAVATRGETLDQATARRLNMLQRVVFGKIGPLPLTQITPVHVLDVLTTAARKNGPSVASVAELSKASRVGGSTSSRGETTATNRWP